MGKVFQTYGIHCQLLLLGQQLVLELEQLLGQLVLQLAMIVVLLFIEKE